MRQPLCNQCDMARRAAIGGSRRSHRQMCEVGKMGKKGSKFYAVASGRTAGVIVSSWDECKDLVHGYAGAKFKSFTTREDAKRYLDETTSHKKNKSTPLVAVKPTTGGFEAKIKQQPSVIKRKTEIPEQPVASVVALPASYTSSSSTTVDNNPYRKRVKLDDRDQTSISNLPTGIRIHIMFDGGARGNPGIAGAGAMVTCTTMPHSSADNDAIPTHHVRCYVGDKSTNNVAEYSGLVKGLAMAKEMVSKFRLQQHATNHPASASFDNELIVQGDSNLIIQQLKGNYKVKNAHLKELFGQVQGLLQELRLLGLSRQIFEHVYRDGNKVADALANEAMDARRSWYTTSADNHREQHTMMDY